MANICFYTAIAVAKDKKSLEEFAKVLNYEHDKFFIPRIYSADFDKPKKDKESGLWTVKVEGDTAWDCDHWFCFDDDTKELVKTKDGKDYAVKGCHQRGIETVCKKLGVGIEIWAEEGGNCFQEHYIIDHNGYTIESASEEWIPPQEDEDGNETEAEGGFEDYLEFCYADEIYGEDYDD